MAATCPVVPSAPSSASRPGRTPLRLLARGLVLTTAFAGLPALTALTAPAAEAATALAPSGGGRYEVWGNSPTNGSNGASALSGRDVTAAAQGFTHGIAVGSDGTAAVYGDTLNPVQAPSAKVRSVAAGYGFVGWATVTGAVGTSGRNTYGATQVPAGLPPIRDVDAGPWHMVALAEDGRAHAWGEPAAGFVPEDLRTTSLAQVSAGDGFNAARTEGGQIRVWGTKAPATPAELGSTQFLDVEAAHARAVVAVQANGDLKAWGTGALATTALPPRPAGHRFVDVECGYAHCLARTDLGAVRVWGDNTNGQLALPTTVATRNVTAITAAGNFGGVVSQTRTTSTGRPTISTEAPSGLPRLHHTLTATAGTFSPAATTLSRQWFADGVPIPGAVHQHFTPQDRALVGKRLSVEVTGRSSQATEFRHTSAATDPLLDAWADVSVSTTGQARVGETLTAAVTSTPTPSRVTWRWMSGASVLGTGNSYTFVPADRGRTVRPEATLTEPGFGTQTFRGEDVTVAGLAFGDMALEVTGTPQVGTVLTATATATPTPSVSYQWKRGETVLSSAASYTPVVADLGQDLTVVASFQATGHETQRITRTVRISGKPLPADLGVTVQGTVAVNSWVSARILPVLPTGTSASYVWRRGGTQVGTGTSYYLREADAGSDLTVHATVQGGGHEPRTLVSEPVPLAALTFTEPLVSVQGTPRVGEPLTVTAEVTPVATGTTVTWWRGDEQVGAGTSYTPVPADVDHPLVARAAFTRPGYTPVSTDGTPTVPVEAADFPGTAEVTLHGQSVVGATLEARATASDAQVEADVEWWRGDQRVGSGTTHDLVAADLGASLQARVRFTRPGHHSTTVVRTSAEVRAGTLTGVALEVTGTPAVGEELRATVRSTPTASATVTWSIDGTEVATGATFRPRAEDLDRSLTASAALDRAGYAPAVPVRPVGTVRAGTMTQVSVTMDHDLDREPTVGTPLRVRASAVPTPALSHRWLRGGREVGTGEVYLPTAADLRARLSVETTMSLPGWTTVTRTVTTEPVAPATFVPVAPLVEATPRVDHPLTATLEVPEGATGTVAWLVDGEQVHVGSSWVPRAVHLGTEISVRGMLTAPGWTPAVSAPVRLGRVTAATIEAPRVDVAGTARVGDTLVAVATSTTAPDRVTHEWRRGTTVVSRQEEYTLTDADEGERLSLTATFHRAGYREATAHASSATVAGTRTPAVSLTSNRATLRAGQQATLTWQVSRSSDVLASWGPVLPQRGSATLKATTSGRQVWSVTAANANGTTTATVVLTVGLPATTLAVTSKVASGKVRKGAKQTKHRLDLRVSGLAARERYTVRVGSRTFRGTATAQGTARVRTTVKTRTFKRPRKGPVRARTTRVRVTVAGSLPDRRGTRVLVLPRRVR